MKIIHKFRHVWHLLVGVANLLFIGLMLWSAFSARIVPAYPYTSVYIGMVFPFFVLINLVFLSYWLLSTRKWVALVPLLALGATFSQITLYCPVHFTRSQIPEGALKVMTYNVCRFNNCDKESSLNEMLPFIIKSNPDILMLQEFGWSSKSKYLLKSDILKALSIYPYYRIVELNRDTDGWHKGGVAVFSKYPLSPAQKIDLSSSFNGAMKCYVNIEGRKVAIYNLHLESNKLTEEDQRNFYSLFENPAKHRIRSIGATLAAKYGLGSSLRSHQAELIDSLVRQEKELVLVGGDFNDTPLSYTYRTVRGDLHDSFAMTGRGLGISYNRNRFYFRIDHLLYSDGLTPFNAQVLKVPYSDHYPLISYFTID